MDKMPYIKKIELKNFKSFGPKTASIMLGKGFTVITGPNGSGKTNIVDAVLFGLGELSARKLRAESFAKLIFHGSPKAGVEKAKVTKVVLQFDNSDNRIPVDTSTVTVSREVYRDGQSVYRLNGRRISRSRVIDILSMAGISPTGHNVVLQGTITRMAEISSHERRKMIADLVGIAQYDAEKAEAEEKLRAAEISIRTAMGRIDEVQKRVNDLERERNELLHYIFLQKEIERFEAVKTFNEILEIERKIDDTKSKIDKVWDKVEKSRQLREQLRSQRREIETEWRKLSSEMVEEGGTQLLGVQIKIGDVKSKLTELTTKMNAGTTSLEGLKKVRENNLEQLRSIKNEIGENRKEIRRLKREREGISKEIAFKQFQYDAISNETAQLRANLGENSKKIKEVEQQIDKLTQSLINLRSNYIRSQTTIKVLSRRLNELKTRRDRFESTLNDVKKSFLDLKSVQKEQINRLRNLERTLERRITQKQSVEKEIDQAGKIAESAREAVVEFATQRELAEKVAIEEKALRNIEELAELGVISGVHGRLRDLIEIESGYEQAIEATAAGWLDAVVVENFDTAFTCTETLKRLKLGRIKMIPLEELSTIKSINPPTIKGTRGPASAFVKCAKRHEPAVIFVFGDTLVTANEKTALAASRSGHRGVTVNGDLFEAGGGIESGYYRAPIDFSSIIPSESAVKSLDEAVTALQDHLARRDSDVAAFEEEIDKIRMENTRLVEIIATLEDEIGRIRRSVKNTRRNIKRIERYIRGDEECLKEEKTRIELQKAQRVSLQKEIKKLREELADLRRKTDSVQIQEMEVQRERLGDEIVKLRRKLGETETALSTLESTFKNVLKIGADNIRIQLGKIKWQILTLEKEVEEARQQKETLEKDLLELEKAKEELSRSVLTAKEESKQFSSQIDEIDKKLLRLDAEYEQSDQLFDELQLSLQTYQLQLDQNHNRLRELGYEEPLEVSPEQLKTAESTLKLLRFELERLGAVNQLAISQYAEQASRYKELSLRMNELEREKQAILSFMDEVERKKRAVFMKAFNQIHESIRKYFSKLTGGGEVTLKLENPEDPFAGGLDMVVQFSGKPPILVSGASSGERSVAAVAFIFALQDFMPAAFYLFDEIDVHLDAFHVEKLGGLLAEESAKSQFLVITLKPEMVSKAEKVYGVYERNGVSHVVSTTFKEAA
ncbi:MAG: Chromosome partition protein Smc [Candidatus Bathyarchaeota archaeon BA2]|nr:MAG: Chromosome partition protein Smc [Candidatus Bathyarchaeota archaeon BA2]